MNKWLITTIIVGIVTWVLAGFGAYHIKNCMFSPQDCSSSLPPVYGEQSTFHSIKEMQAWCGAYPDGKWGMETDRLYKQKYNETYGNNIALELWPEMEK